jgi:hypothetical protein
MNARGTTTVKISGGEVNCEGEKAASNPVADPVFVR